jgi:hypothetical protein
MTTPGQPPRPDGTPQQQLADQMEISFNQAGRTLTDEDTAETYLLTLALVARALEGAEAQDIITSAQRCELAEVIEGMRAAPRLV